MGTYLKHHIKALHAVRLITVQYETWWKSMKIVYYSLLTMMLFLGRAWSPPKVFVLHEITQIVRCQAFGIHPGRITWNVQMTHLYKKKNDLPNLYDYVPCLSSGVYHGQPLLAVSSGFHWVSLGGSCNHRGLPRCQTNGLARLCSCAWEAGGSSHVPSFGQVYEVPILSTDHGTDFLVMLWCFFYLLLTAGAEKTTTTTTTTTTNNS